MSRLSNDPLILASLASQNVIDLMDSGANIAELTHPLYDKSVDDWEKFRLTYRGKYDFIDTYLRKFSIRETDAEFYDRKSITYVPAFAKSGVNEVKDSIFQRLPNVNRSDGPESYQKAIVGNIGGVDMLGASMNAFLNLHVLPELLSMSKVGVYVDSPTSRGQTLADRTGHPYIYTYKAEDIRNWAWQSTGDTFELRSLLLRDIVHDVDDTTGLPTGTFERFRLYWVQKDGTVWCQFFDADGKPTAPQGASGVTPQRLPTTRIPFSLFELNASILDDVADYQIALMNLESSDITYSLKSNVAFYTEQFNPLIESPFLRTPSRTESTGTTVAEGGEVKDSNIAKSDEITMGAGTARRYPKDLDRPGFIHPSAEPLRVSMAKEEQMKRDIRMLIKLAVQNLAPSRESAESKGMDERSLEAGLSAIGLVLETGERQIATLWAEYENSEPPEIGYPAQYDLKSDKDRRDGAKAIQDTMHIPSITYRREATKQITTLLMGDKVSMNTLQAIHSEIDRQEVITTPEEIEKDVKSGLLSLGSAAAAKQYPKDEVEKAAKDHADRVARVVQSQASARGADDLGGIAPASEEEKTDDTLGTD